MEPTQPLLERDGVTGETKAGCWMLDGALLHAESFAPPIEIGSDVDFSRFLRSIRVSRPAIGMGTFVSALADRRRFGRLWGSSPAPSGARSGPPGERCVLLPQPTLRPLEPWRREPRSGCLTLRKRVAAATQSALQSDAFRIDASDLMPDGDRRLTQRPGPGAFFQGMVDWVDRTPPIDEVLDEIDAAWAVLDDGVAPG